MKGGRQEDGEKNKDGKGGRWGERKGGRKGGRCGRVGRKGGRRRKMVKFKVERWGRREVKKEEERKEGVSKVIVSSSWNSYCNRHACSPSTCITYSNMDLISELFSINISILVIFLW